MLDGGLKSKADQYGQMNFAPAEPLRLLKQDKDKSYQHSNLASLLKEFHDETKMRYVNERRETAEVGRIMANLRSGKLVMKRNPVSGVMGLLKPLPHTPRRDQHIYPLAQVNSSQLTSVWTLSRPRAVPRHFGDTNKAQIQHALVEKIIAHYDVELFDELFHQRESLSMMDYGTAVIHVFYDQRKSAITHLKPIIEDVETTVFEGYGACLACGHEGTDADFPAATAEMPECPECGSFQISDLIPAQKVTGKMIVGAKEESQGDIGADLRNIPACNWEMSKLAHESNFFNYRSEVSHRLVTAVLGIDDIEETDGTIDTGLSIINEIASRGGSVEGYGRERFYGHSEASKRMAIMDEEWYSPEWYAGCRFEKAEKTVSGQTIPANTPLEEIFPDGICVVGFNDMQIIAGVYGEKNRNVGGVYHLQSHSGYGKGTSDVIEVAEQLNMAHSANLAVLDRYGAGGGYWYDKDVMSKAEAKALLKPGGLVGISMRGTNYAGVEGALRQLQHKEISHSNIAMIAQLANMINICFQTTEFTQGVASEQVNVNTLGGQQMLAAQNQQRSAAPLRMKGYMRARVAEQIIDLFRENIKIPKFFGSQDKFSLTKGKFIAGDQLPENVRCDFVPDSEQPTNTYTKRMNAEAMLEKSQYFGAPFIEVAKADPRIATWWAGQFQVEMPLYNQNDLLIVCQERIENLKELAEEAEQMSALSGMQTDPAIAGEQMVDGLRRKLNMSEENHVIKAQILSEYLDDDEAMEWSPLMRAGFNALINRHYTYDRDNRFRIASLENEAQIALAAQQQQARAAMQQQMMQQRAAAQAEAMAGQQEQEMLMAGLGQAAQMVDKEEDFQREQEAADLDHERKMQETAMGRVLDREDADRDYRRQRGDATVERQAASRDAEKEHTRNLEIKKYERNSRPGSASRR